MPLTKISNILNNNFKLLLNFHRTKTKTATDYCLDLVRKNDYENFICTLLLKNTSRNVALTIRALNIELAKVLEQSSQPNIGVMRLKFWEDTINKCYGNDVSKVPQHPVAQSLYQVLQSRKLSKRYLSNLITSRIDALKVNIFPTIDLLEKYSESSVSSIYYLLLEGNNVRNVQADHAASHLGKAQGIIQQLRSITVARKINFIAIPQDILNKNNLSHEVILRGKISDDFNKCSFEVASRAHQHLVKARSLLNSVPKEGRSVLLPAVIVDNYLKRLENVQHNLLHPSLQKRGWIWLPKLWIYYVKNIY